MGSQGSHCHGESGDRVGGQNYFLVWNKIFFKNSEKMTPHPLKDIDLERKEELIMAKQLRAARVTILPKKINSSYVERKEPPRPVPQAPKIQPKSVAKAQNPIALRYWNQCMSLSTQAEVKPPPQDENVSNQSFDPSQPPWAMSDTRLPPYMADTGVNGKKTEKIRVPNINKQIKYDTTSRRTDWAKILAEEEEHLEKHKKFKMNQSQKLQIETPAFLRKQRPLNLGNFDNSNGTNCENENVPYRKVNNLKKENEAFFEHIKKMKNIDEENKLAQNTKGLKDSSCGNSIPLKNKNSQTNMEGPKKEEMRNGDGITNENNLSIDTSPINKKNKDVTFHQTSKKRITKVDDDLISNKEISVSTKQNGIERLGSKPNGGKSQTCSCQHSLTEKQSTDSALDMDQHVNNITQVLSETQKTAVGILCFDKLSPDVKDDLLGRHLSTIHVSELTKLLSLIKEEVLFESLLSILPQSANSVEHSLHKKDVVIEAEDKQIKTATINDETDSKEMEIAGDKNQICQTKKISDECEEVVHTREINSKMEEQHNKPEDDYSETAPNKIEFESSEDGTIGFALVDEKSISDDIDVKENVMKDYSLSCEEDTHICESDDADYAGKDDFEGNQSNVLEKVYNVDSGSIGTQNFEDDTSKDMSINESSENRDYLSNGNDKEKEEEEENKVSDMTNLLEGENCENNATESEDDSWEYEWEEEEEYEYEYYEEEDDEYKVQKFDGSFSVSLKT